MCSGITPSFGNDPEDEFDCGCRGSRRAREILAWVRINCGQSRSARFVVLDDQDLCPGISDSEAAVDAFEISPLVCAAKKECAAAACLRPHFVHVNADYGLREADSNEAVRILFKR